MGAFITLFITVYFNFPHMAWKQNKTHNYMALKIFIMIFIHCFSQLLKEIAGLCYSLWCYTQKMKK
jgi:hypothetical protein